MTTTITHILLQIKTYCYRITGYNPKQYNTFTNPIFICLALCCTGLILLAYGNHFSNTFHFDDSHTIENNGAIQEINPLLFFTDATTFSTLPTNQTYRPYTVLENAIDYRIAKGLDPKTFHVHIFITFIILCIGICIFVKKVLDDIHFSNYNQFWALLIAFIFGTLCANAETVNYSIQRAEITAALYVIFGLAAYIQGGFWKKTYAYLLFPFIGFFAKEMALVFAPVLLLYIVLFEEKVYLLHGYKKEEFKKCIRALTKVMPAFIISIIFYAFHASMLPDTLALSHVNRYQYLITQPMVICHYFITYFVPYNLSIDTDWKVYNTIFDYRAILGIIGVISLIYIALKASKNAKTRLFSFGILWFFITLLPTSSFIPLSEVLNDHRAFTPYIGLTIAFVFGIKHLYEKYTALYNSKHKIQYLLVFSCMLFISGNIYGVRKRNIVWKTEVSLWKDATIKSPKNGRGLMNYGIALMGIGDYTNAEIYYKKAIELNPNYDILYVNLGILKNAQKHPIEAENYLKKAVELNASSYAAWYHYGMFLTAQKRYQEAKNAFLKVLEISPRHLASSIALLDIHHTLEEWENLKTLVSQTLQQFPNNPKVIHYHTIATQQKLKLTLLEEEIDKTPTPKKYLDLSLQYFQNYKFQKTIEAANKALALKNKYPEAYNNIGIAHFKLGAYKKAINAYQKALAINPTYQLAKNNLKAAQNALNIQLRMTKKLSKLNTADACLNFSLTCYNNKLYYSCIEAAKKSIAIHPNANAYNNICCAYNQLNLYDNAITACNKALQIDPNHVLAKGNLNHANTLKKNHK